MIDSHGRVITGLVSQLGDGGFDGNVSVGQGLAGSAVSAFFLTLVVGAILVALRPEYVERVMAAVADEPFDSFLYGFAAFLVIVVLLVALVFSLIGIPAAFALFFGAYLVWILGATVAFLAIADRLVDRDGGWLLALLVAAGMNGSLAFTGIGWLVSAVVGLAGFGAVLRDALD